MLKEARIVMPRFDTEVSQEVHEQLAYELIRHFGGYTLSTGNGGWMHNGKVVDDVVNIYDVAMEARSSNNIKLARVAMDAAKALNQQAVYIRYVDGAVEIKDVPIADDRVIAAEPEAPSKLPQAGEIWSTRDGSVVAVVDGRAGRAPGFSCVGLHFATVSWRRGHEFVVEPNGRFVTLDIAVHPLDLVRHISSY